MPFLSLPLLSFKFNILPDEVIKEYIEMEGERMPNIDSDKRLVFVKG